MIDPLIFNGIKTSLVFLLFIILHIYIYAQLFKGFFIRSIRIGIIIKLIYLTYRWDTNRYYCSKLVDMGVMARNGYLALRKYSELEPYH